MPLTCFNCKAPIESHFKACPSCGEPITDFLRQYADKPLDGKYQIISRLGGGGMGEVYKARHTHLDAIRVIKVIRGALTHDTDAAERFIREARLATKIHHPNVSTLHDFSALPDGAYYMVWEYIEGFTLGELIRSRGTLTASVAAAISIEVLMGLEAIHRAGVIHRDISPDNIMITNADGEQHVKIIDLGIAKQGDNLDNQTRTGMFIGKLKYCSPEHLGLLDEGEHIDGRSDIYSFGIVMYEMLTGTPPFVATGPHQYFLQHSRETPKPIHAVNPGAQVPPELEAMIFKALEKDRVNRFASAREFARELERLLPSLEATGGASAIGRTTRGAITEETFRGVGDESRQPTAQDFADAVLEATASRSYPSVPPKTDRATIAAGTATVTDRATIAAGTASVTDRATIAANATDRSTVAASPASPLTDQSTVAAGPKPSKSNRSPMLWVPLLAAVTVAIVTFALLMMRSETRKPQYAVAKPQPIRTTAAFPPSVIVPSPSATLPGVPASTTTTVIGEPENSPAELSSTSPLPRTTSKRKELTPQEIRSEEEEVSSPAPSQTGGSQEIAETREEESPQSNSQGGQSRVSGIRSRLGRLVGGGGGKSLADSPEYQQPGFQKGIIPDYDRLKRGSVLQWEYLAPGIKLSDYKINVSNFRNMSHVKSGRLLSILQDDLQAALNDATEETSKGRLTTNNAIYWAEDAQSKKRGVGVEMIFRDSNGRVVAEIRHAIRENSPEDAAEEVAEAIADFVQDHSVR